MPADDRDSLPDVADRDELLRILTGAARNGNVSAAKELLAELRREDETTPDAIDDFAALDNVTQLRGKKAS